MKELIIFAWTVWSVWTLLCSWWCYLLFRFVLMDRKIEAVKKRGFIPDTTRPLEILENKLSWLGGALVTAVIFIGVFHSLSCLILLGIATLELIITAYVIKTKTKNL